MADVKEVREIHTYSEVPKDNSAIVLVTVLVIISLFVIALIYWQPWSPPRETTIINPPPKSDTIVVPPSSRPESKTDIRIDMGKTDETGSTDETTGSTSSETSEDSGG